MTIPKQQLPFCVLQENAYSILPQKGLDYALSDLAQEDALTENDIITHLLANQHAADGQSVKISDFYGDPTSTGCAIVKLPKKLSTMRDR